MKFFKDPNVILQLTFFVLSGAFALGIFSVSFGSIESRITKNERKIKRQDDLLCLIGLEIVQDQKKKKLVEKLCLKEDAWKN